MATVAKPESTTDVEGDQLVVFEGVEWGGYNSVLKLRGARGLPKVVYLDGRLTIMSLGEDGAYAPAAESRAVPGLTPSEVHSWITRDDFPDDFEWRRVLRRWVDEELAPRREEEIP